MDHAVGFILAAGLGTRLRPATETIPKPLVPVAGVEPLFFNIWKLNNAGVKTIFVNGSYLHEQIKESLLSWSKLFKDIDLRFVDESAQVLGTGGSLLKVIRENESVFKDKSLIVINGDTVSNINLESMLDSPEKNKIAVSKNPDFFKKYHPLWLDTDTCWAGIGVEAPDLGLNKAHYLGIHVLAPSSIKKILNYRFDVRNIDLFNGLYRPLTILNELFEGVDFEITERSGEYWFDMTNKQFLLEAQECIFSKYLEAHWSNVLVSRYPEIRQNPKDLGVWLMGEAKHLTFKGPCVVVNSSSFDFMPAQVGPNAFVIVGEGLGSEKNAVVSLKNALFSHAGAVLRTHLKEIVSIASDDITVI